MTMTEERSNTAVKVPTRPIDMKLEIVVIPVWDVDRAKAFYARLGWRLDADFASSDGWRVIQFTPPGSPASVIFGTNVTAATPGSAQGLYLIVSDIEDARKELVADGIDVSEVFHLGPNGPASGPHPERCSYYSFASFSDPDGNSWLLQEITTRLPGRVDSGETTFSSTSDLANALRRTETAHGKHEQRNGGQRDANWPDWYSAYMVAEQTGAELSQ